ncbi:MAG: DegV family protein [Bacteroidota bacterium]
MKIGIVTDSTSDLPLDLVSKYDIEVIPLHVSMDNQNYRDGVDLTATQFYQKLKTCGSLPTTSQPSPGAFVECYRALLKKVDAILSIHLTEALSGTIRTARMAREILPEANIQVIDSHSTSMGLGSLVLEAAQAVRRGVKIEEVLKLIEGLREKVNFLVTLDTLEYIRKSGRVSALQAFFGSILQIKPLLKLVNGKVELIDRVRTRHEAIGRLLKDFKSQLAVETEGIIAVMHTAAEEEAEKLRVILRETFAHAEIILSQAGPVLGTHVGPGAIALIAVPRG